MTEKLPQSEQHPEERKEGKNSSELALQKITKTDEGLQESKKETFNHNYGDEKEIGLEKKITNIKKKIYKTKNEFYNTKRERKELEERLGTWFGLNRGAIRNTREKETGLTEEIKSFQERLQELQRQVEEIHETLDIEALGEKVEFSALCQEVKEGIENGRILYNLVTKPPSGMLFMGHQFEIITCGGHEHIYLSSGKKMKEIDYHYEGGDLINYARHPNHLYLVKAQKGKGTYIRDEKGYQVEKEEKLGDVITLKDIIEENKERDKKMYALYLMYTGYSKGYLGDSRLVRSSICLLMESKLSWKIVQGIKEQHGNYWEFIGAVFPDLLKAWPPGNQEKKSASDPISVYESEEYIPLYDMAKYAQTIEAKKA